MFGEAGDGTGAQGKVEMMEQAFQPRRPTRPLREHILAEPLDEDRSPNMRFHTTSSFSKAHSLPA
jgi:hypothetical protein